MNQIINSIKKNTFFYVAICAILLILYWYSLSIYGLKNVIKNQKYTIAKVDSDWHYKNNNGVGVDYEYSIENHKFEYTGNYKVKKNEYFLLIFDSLKPKNSAFLEIYPISDNLIPPVNGWKYNEVPLKIDSAKIRKYVLD